jgi:hypothetical protein
VVELRERRQRGTELRLGVVQGRTGAGVAGREQRGGAAVRGQRLEDVPQRAGIGETGIGVVRGRDLGAPASHQHGRRDGERQQQQYAQQGELRAKLETG